MSKARNFRKSVECMECVHSDLPGGFVTICSKFNEQVPHNNTCNFAMKRPHGRRICGYKGCDGEVMGLGFEGAKCLKCGEHFI